MMGLDAKLLIAGRGKDEDSLKEMAQNLGLENLAFRGFVGEEEKKDLLRNCQALVLPSKFRRLGHSCP